MMSIDTYKFESRIVDFLPYSYYLAASFVALSSSYLYPSIRVVDWAYKDILLLEMGSIFDIE